MTSVTIKALTDKGIAAIHHAQARQKKESRLFERRLYANMFEEVVANDTKIITIKPHAAKHIIPYALHRPIIESMKEEGARLDIDYKLIDEE